MTYRVLSFFFLAILMSCSSGDMESEDAVLDDSQDMKEELMELMGEFVMDAHPTMGKAVVNEERTKLSLTEFKSDSGPILEMYLATDLKATKFISLGELKGLEGDYTYELPSNVNFETYKYLLVWCVDFSVSFGHAELE